MSLPVNPQRRCFDSRRYLSGAPRSDFGFFFSRIKSQRKEEETKKTHLIWGFGILSGSRLTAKGKIFVTFFLLELSGSFIRMHLTSCQRLLFILISPTFPSILRRHQPHTPQECFALVVAQHRDILNVLTELEGQANASRNQALRFPIQI